MVRFSRLAPLALAAGVAARALLAQEGDAAPETPALVTSPMPFIGITPCRIVDTRSGTFPPGYGPPSISPGPPRTFTLTGQCGIPAGARAVSLNVTAVNPRGNGYLLLYPQGGAQPAVSTVNYLDITVANAAVVPLGTGGGIAVAASSNVVDLLLDVNGYFGASAADPSNTFLAAGNATTAGQYNTAGGTQALFSNGSGSYNTAAGWHCLFNNTSGARNTAVGYGALVLNTMGSDNTATLENLTNNATGSGNTALGLGALGSSTGSSNTGIGAYTLDWFTSGDNNIAIGHGAGFSLTTGFNNIYIGEDVDGGNGSPASEDNTIRIGSTVGYWTTAYMGGVRGASVLADGQPVFIDNTGLLGTAISSKRYKEDVHDMADASRTVLDLRPVTFRYKNQAGARRQFGLLAEDVAAGAPDLAVRDVEGRPEAVLYQELPAILLNEMQKQAARLEAGDQDILAERERLERQREQALEAQTIIDELERRLATLESEAGPSSDHP